MSQKIEQCPQCKATDDVGTYVSESGINMCACGRCFIQWRALASHAPSEAAAQPTEVPVDDKYMENFGGAPNENWSETTIDNEGTAWVLRSEAEVRIAEALLHPETWNNAKIEHNDH